MFGPTDTGSMLPHDDVKCQEELVFEGNHHLTPVEELALIDEALGLLAQKDSLTPAEAFVLANMVGTADICRQVLCGERIVKTVPKNKTAGTVLNGLLEESDGLFECSPISLFVACEKFVENRNGEVPIAFIYGDARDFLDIREENIPAAVLKRHKVLQRATDRHIIAAFGDKDLAKIERAKSYAAHVYAFLRDRANVFKCYTCFVLGASGNPLSLHIWHDDGWHIEVLPVPYPRELEVGDFVVAH